MTTENSSGRKIFAPLRILGRIWLNTVKNDTNEAVFKISGGLFFMILSLCFFFNLILVLNIVCMFSFNLAFKNWLYSGLATLGLQGTMALLFLILARKRLQGPYFQDTKKILAEGLQELS